MTELINAAGVCKTSVAEYYQTKGALPTGADAGCSTIGTANSGAPVVAAGVITVTAAGGLQTQLGAGTDALNYTPVTAAPGQPITDWDCKTGTTILPKYLPASCR
ncbi:MAG TPA: pilin [Usitatibacter sp.]|nr:pilin [Usitatibacter sp.]